MNRSVNIGRYRHNYEDLLNILMSINKRRTNTLVSIQMLWETFYFLLFLSLVNNDEDKL